MDFDDMDEGWKKAVKALAKEEGFEVDEIENITESPYGFGYNVDFGKQDYYAFLNGDDAEAEAIDWVKNDLDNEPGIFNQDWLNGFVTITDADRRMMATEESDNYVDNMDEDEILKEAGMDSEYDDLDQAIMSEESKIEEIEEEITTWGGKKESRMRTEKLKELDIEVSNARAEVERLEKEKEALVDKARDKLIQEKYDEVYEALEDPIQYFVEDQGIYSREDLLKQAFIIIDVEEAAQDAVNTDGIAHFLSSYDGEEHELDDVVYYRHN
jgi:hypothetical protein